MDFLSRVLLLLKPRSGKLLRRLTANMEVMMTTQAELAAQLATVSEAVAKIGSETANTLQQVIDLQAQVDELLNNQGAVTPELKAAVDALYVQVQAVDDLVPDQQP